MKTLEGKVAIVTGGGTGIGKETAIIFAREGAIVVLAGRRLRPLEEVATQVKQAGGHAVARATDLEDGNAAAELGDWTVAEFGRVDILVNNAGHGSKARSIRYLREVEWQSVYKVNVEGVYRLTQACVNPMIEQGGGVVITVSSYASIRPGLLGGAAYSSAKAASHNLMYHTNVELNARGIRACTIIPAEVDTPILNNRPLPPDAEARSTMMMPEDIAQAIYLCATMPARTVVEEIRLRPTQARDVSEELQAAAEAKSPRS